MNKEFKVVIWAGIFIFIMFLYALVNGSKEDANQIINILLYSYLIVAFFTFINGIYKWIKGFFPKKDIPKL